MNKDKLIEALRKQLVEAETHAEQVKAGLYATLGKIGTLKETITTIEKGE